MSIHELLRSEFDLEAAKTRATLERVPAQPDFAPHAKSMPLGKLSAHLAQLGGFGTAILTLPSLDFATAGMKPLAFESAPQLLSVWEEGAGKVREALAATADEAWRQPWKLHRGETVFFAGNRFGAYRAMFLNHLVHHRAQLGVYLRLLGVPVPAIYGPSADER